jgi:shikimate dehydrogenase
MTRTLLGVAGFPVAHSRSPAMHNAALGEMGLDWLYVPVPVSPGNFAEVVRALPGSGFRGINVTVPHKLAANELADRHSEAAEGIGAANTLTFADGAIAADNTDAGGFLDALGADPAGLRALVLGAGGSARAVVWALAGAGAAEVWVLNRSHARAEELASDLGAAATRSVQPADLLVNCTSVGLDPAVSEDDALAALALAAADPPETVVDLVYRDGMTPVEAWARRGGASFVGGLEVLVGQGARSLRGWTGADVPRDAMREAAQRALQ